MVDSEENYFRQKWDLRNKHVHVLYKAFWSTWHAILSLFCLNHKLTSLCQDCSSFTDTLLRQLQNMISHLFFPEKIIKSRLFQQKEKKYFVSSNKTVLSFYTNCKLSGLKVHEIIWNENKVICSNRAPLKVTCKVLVTFYAIFVEYKWLSSKFIWPSESAKHNSVYLASFIRPVFNEETNTVYETKQLQG